MREAIGGTWITQLVIVFMLIFVAFLALSLNYSKAFQMKNELLTIIEKKEGVTTESIGIMNNYLSKNGYNIKGACDVGSYGVTSLQGNTIEKVTNKAQKYYYCVTKYQAPEDNIFSKAYYKVEMYFYFNLPIIGDIFKFNINGTTNNIVVPGDNLQFATK